MRPSLGPVPFPSSAGDAEATLSPGSMPAVTSMVLVEPSRQTVSEALSPGFSEAMSRDNSRGSAISRPLTARMASPAFKPALPAGPSAVTPATSAPLVSLRPRPSARSAVTGWICTPSPRVESLCPERRTTECTVCAGMSKGDADAAAIGRVDRRVDADHLARQVEGRPAGIAAVDRRVDLQEVVIGTGADVAAARRDDARRHGAAEAEGIADGDDPIADARRDGCRASRREKPERPLIYTVQSETMAVTTGDSSDLTRRALSAASTVARLAVSSRACSRSSRPNACTTRIDSSPCCKTATISL